MQKSTKQGSMYGGNSPAPKMADTKPERFTPLSDFQVKNTKPQEQNTGCLTATSKKYTQALAANLKFTLYQPKQLMPVDYDESDAISMKHQLDALTDAIAQEESRLARLEIERASILSRLGGLRGYLAALEAGTMPLRTPPPYPQQQRSRRSAPSSRKGNM